MSLCLHYNDSVSDLFLHNINSLFWCAPKQIQNDVNFRFFASQPKTYSDGSDEYNKNEKLLSVEDSHGSSSGSGNGSGSGSGSGKFCECKINIYYISDLLFL